MPTMNRATLSRSFLLKAAVLLSMMWPLSVPSISAADATRTPETENSADCQLILEGRQIEKLVLSNEQGKVINLVHPGDTTLLPAGDYQIEEIEVQGGYVTRWVPNSPSLWPPPKNRLLSLSPNQPCQPNIGGPLKASIDISAKRKGRLVQATYHLWLRGVEQSPYSPAHCGEVPPTKFTVYQGDREITGSGCGSLEYG
jgi:hypothetical protein